MTNVYRLSLPPHEWHYMKTRKTPSFGTETRGETLDTRKFRDQTNIQNVPLERRCA